MRPACSRVGQVLVTLILATAVMGAAESTLIFPASGTSAAAPATGGGFGTMSLVLGAILAAAGCWLFWRGRRTSSRAVDGRALAIEETRSLGNRQFLVVASYQNKKFLLGVCPGRIDHLAVLPDERTHP